MGLFDNGVKIGVGLAVGFGTVLLAPVVIPALARVAKPLAKEIIRGAWSLLKKARFWQRKLKRHWRTWQLKPRQS